MRPRVSVVVPTLDRPDSLAALLDALAHQDYPRDRLEVVIVDDGSRPPVTPPSSDLPIVLLRLERTGPGAARNAGVEAASGEVVAMIDDDCLPRRNWLDKLIGAWEAQPTALVGGRTVALPDHDVYARACQHLINALTESFDAHSSSNVFLAGANLACARDRFLALGGFDEAFSFTASEDRDLSDRWRESAPLVTVQEAVAEHHSPLSAMGFLTRHFRYGRGARLLRMRRFRRGEAKFRVEPGSFYGRLLAYPFRVEPWYRAPFISALFLASQACGAAGYLYEANATWMREAAMRPFRRSLMRRNLVLLNDTLAATPIAGRYWIIGGLLIGIAREGDVLAHDAADSDFGIHRADLGRLMEAAAALEQAGFRPTHRYLDNEGAVAQLTWHKDGARFDFNVHDGFPNSCGYTCFGTIFPGGRPSPIQIRGELPAFDLAPIRFLGREWKKPADHDWYLTSIYGDWRTPRPEYDYRTDDRSIVETVPWRRSRESRFPARPRPYRYRCTDGSRLSGFISAKLAPDIERYLPDSWSANTLTCAGSALVWAMLAGIALTSTSTRTRLAPLWVAFLWSYCLLDHIDGCRARKRGTSGPRGEFLDHGLDAWNGSLVVLALALLSAPAIQGAVTAFALSCIGVTTAAVWLEQKQRGELVLPAIGPVEALLGSGLFMAAWRFPEIAERLRSALPGVPQLTGAEFALAVGTGASLVHALTTVRRTRGILLPLLLLVGVISALLLAGLYGAGWGAVHVALALTNGEYSARIIRSHLTESDVPWVDILGPASLLSAALIPAAALPLMTTALVWLVARSAFTWRSSLRVLL